MLEVAEEARKSTLPIHSIKWCQDPLLSRAAGLYISERVRGVGRRIIMNRYGVLNGNYAGLPSHRLEVCLDLLATRTLPSFSDVRLVEAFEAESVRLDGEPIVRCSVLKSESNTGVRVPIPWDFSGMKENGTLAASWQAGVVEVMSSLCERGYRVVNFRRAEDPQWGEYMMLRS